MAGFTRYAQKKVLDHALGIAAWTMPAGVYLALFTADPTEDGLQTNEVGSGIGYSRQALTANMAATVLATGQAVNSNIILFGPAATSPWTLISHWGTIDASSAGNMIQFGPLSTSFTVNVGESLPIDVASLVLTVD
jgi:hypothetical protein